MKERWLHALCFVRNLAHAMIGLPSYRAYLLHMARSHPGLRPMDYPAFFRNRQQARYAGRGGSRCC